jgi:GntR family transcriptional regulator
MQQELQQSLNIAVGLVELENLTDILAKYNFGTLVTNRYFIQEVLAIVPSGSFRVIPIDIYNYAKELTIIKNLPPQACLGIVSLSQGTLGIAASIVNSQRGDDLLVLTATINDTERLKALVRTAHTIISGPSSYDSVKNTIAAVRDDLIRIPEVIRSDNYIGEKSIELLKRELGV